MSIRALTALDHGSESDVAVLLDRSPGVSVVRRCADLEELLAAAAAGLGDVAVLSCGVPGLDRDAVDQLERSGLAVCGVVRPGDDDGDHRLRQLGAGQVFATGTAAADVALLLRELVEATAERAAQPTGTGHPVSHSPGASVHSPAASTGLDRAATQTPTPSADPEVAPPPLRRGGVLAVWGPTGAPGRSTVAVALAAEIAQAGRETLLVDADTYGACVGQLLGLLDEAPGMAAAARAAEQGGLDATALARLAPQVSRGLRVLTGLPRADRWSELREGALEQVLSCARAVAEVVVVDCGFGIEDDEVLSYDTAAPRRNGSTLTVLAEADELVVVGGADPVGLQRLVRAVQEVRLVPSPTPTVVVNRVRASAVGPDPQRRISETLARFAGLERLHFLPACPDDLDAAVLAGRTLAEHRPRSPLRAAVRELADHLGYPPDGVVLPDRRRRRSTAG